MSSISLAEYRELFPVKTKKCRSAKQGTRQPSEGETVLATHLRACKISFEQVNSDKTDFTMKFALICLIKNKVENKGLGKVAQETNQSKAQAAIMVSCARFYLASHDKRLELK